MIKRFTLLLLAGLLATILSYGQNEPTVSHHFKNDPLGKVRDTLQALTGYVFWDELPGNAFSFSGNFDREPLRKVLAKLYYPQNCDFTIVGRIINVKKKPVSTWTIIGKVIDDLSAPIAGATVTNKNKKHSAVTNEQGLFKIDVVSPSDMLEVSMVSYETWQRKITNNDSLVIQLQPSQKELDSISINQNKRFRDSSNLMVLSTISSNISSLITVDNPDFSRNPSPFRNNRLMGIASGVLLNRNIVSEANQSSISIRSRSTINANAEPLNTVEGMPYHGNIDNYNLNDFESISIFKDATSISKFVAVLSGNGVMDHTLKKGTYKTPLQVYLHTALSVEKKPDIFYPPQMAINDYIDVERYLFDHGHYNAALNNPSQVISPAVEILNKKRLGLISASEADNQLLQLSKYDMRNSINKYFVRTGFYQQDYISITGGGNNQRYFFSLGYDKNISTFVGNSSGRYTGHLNNAFAFGKNRSELLAGIYFSINSSKSNAVNFGGFRYPYGQLADEQGNPLAIPRDYKQSYIDTAGYGRLLDWNYRPLDELKLADNSAHSTILHYYSTMNLKITKNLELNISGTRQMEWYDRQYNYSEQTYMNRDLMNQYTEINGASIKNYIPAGLIITENVSSFTGQSLKTGISYLRTGKKKSTLVIAGGWEMQEVNIRNKRTQTYAAGSSIANLGIDYNSLFPIYQQPGLAKKIPHVNEVIDSTDRFVSWHGNVAYTLNSRYTLMANIRKDASNIFGTEANRKGVPLGSIGISWEISNEPFFKNSIFPFVRLRYSDGFCGNVNKSISSSAILLQGFNNTFGAQTSVVLNPPVPDLRWESIRITNIGFDITSFKTRLAINLDLYFKKGTDLFGSIPVDPSSGFSTFNGNVAEMDGRGIDLTVNAKIINHKDFEWSNTTLFSHVTDKVKDYKVKRPGIGYYLDQEALNPLEGKPLYSLYALPFLGLDGTNGDPISYMDGHETKNYSALLQSMNFKNLIYYGPATPTYFGSIRNTFRYKKLELSLNIVWKAGYYFRKNTIKYTNLFNSRNMGHPDFPKRWQLPGDEKFTNIPSMIYPANSARDMVFYYSIVNVEKGDHVRLQDIRLSYLFNDRKCSDGKQPSFKMECYVYANEVALLWKAARSGTDPDFINAPPNSRSITIGFKANF